ncbi:MAG: ComF family protein [bacterium]
MFSQLVKFKEIIKEPFLDLLFPRQCLGCGLAETWLCDSCFSRIKIENRLLTGYGYLDGVWAVTSFNNPLVQKAIHLLKYQYVSDLALVLGKLISQPANYIINEDWLLLPVPLHRKKFLARGFNQAELLAKEIQKETNWPVLTDVLARKINNKAQVNLKKEARENNVQGIFSINNEEKITNKNILLIDDVLTTGATLSECAKLLKTNGANLVRGLVIAHG